MILCNGSLNWQKTFETIHSLKLVQRLSIPIASISQLACNITFYSQYTYIACIPALFSLHHTVLPFSCLRAERKMPSAPRTNAFTALAETISLYEVYQKELRNYYAENVHHDQSKIALISDSTIKLIVTKTARPAMQADNHVALGSQNLGHT